MLAQWNTRVELNQSQRQMLATMLSTQNNTNCVLEPITNLQNTLHRVYEMLLLLREEMTHHIARPMRLGSRCNRFTSTNNMISNYMFALAIFMFTSSQVFFSSFYFALQHSSIWWSITCAVSYIYIRVCMCYEYFVRATSTFLYCPFAIYCAVEKRLTWLRWYHARFLLGELHV